MSCFVDRIFLDCGTLVPTNLYHVDVHTLVSCTYHVHTCTCTCIMYIPVSCTYLYHVYQYLYIIVWREARAVTWITWVKNEYIQHKIIFIYNHEHCQFRLQPQNTDQAGTVLMQGLILVVFNDWNTMYFIKQSKNQKDTDMHCTISQTQVMIILRTNQSNIAQR